MNLNRRKFLRAASGLFVPMVACGQEVLLSRTFGNRTPAAAAGGPSYLVSEDFESGSAPAGWSVTGTPTWDYATSPAPLVGNYSLYFPLGTIDIYTPDFAAQADLWVYFMFNNDLSSAIYLVELLDASNVQLAAARLLTTGGFRLYNAAGFTATATGLVTANATYHCWLHYVKGTGADSTTTLYLSANGTRGAAVGSDTGEATTDAVKVAWITSPTKIILDKLRVSATEIGDNPT